MIAAASTREKLEVCRKSGADLLLNYREPRASDGGGKSKASPKGAQGDWRGELKKLTAGRGVDVVLDNVGGSDCEASAPFPPIDHPALYFAM